VTPGRSAPLRRLYVNVAPVLLPPGQRATVTFRIRVRIRGRFRPVVGAAVSFAGRRHSTNSRGYASFRVRFGSAGRYRATVVHALRRNQPVYSPWVRVVRPRQPRPSGPPR
jgi:hypothetical protein